VISAHGLILMWLKDITDDFDVVVSTRYSPTIHVYRGPRTAHIDIIVELISSYRLSGLVGRNLILYRGETADQNDLVREMPFNIEDPGALDKARSIIRKHLRKYVAFM
jgi:hypothetical protein